MHISLPRQLQPTTLSTQGLRTTAQPLPSQNTRTPPAGRKPLDGNEARSERSAGQATKNRLLRQLPARQAVADQVALQAPDHRAVRWNRPSLQGRQFVSTTTHSLEQLAAAARTPIFFTKACATSALPQAQQAGMLTALSRNLSQLDQNGRVGGFGLLTSMSAGLPTAQRAQVLAALAKRLPCLPASERRAGFNVLLGSAASLPAESAAPVLSALAGSLHASGKDKAGFDALHAQSGALNDDGRARVMPGLIRQIGVLPIDQRKAAFDTLTAQLPSLTPQHCGNGLKGLAGKVRKLPQRDRAGAFDRLSAISSALPTEQRGNVQLRLQAIAA